MPANDDPNNSKNTSLIARMSLRGIGLASTNIALAVIYMFFAVANLRSFLENPRLSVLLIVLVETIAAIFLIIRRDPDETRHTWQTWTTTTCGTFAPMFFRPVEATADLLIGDIFQVIGVVVQIAALLCLNRSFGLLPAYRGVKSYGPYSWVRHPLYTAYVVSFVGYWINNQSTVNAAIVIFGSAFLVLRIFYEEALLLEYDDYTRYANRTRWRLIPAIW